MAANNQLVKLLEAIAAARADAEIDIDAWPMKVRAGKSISKADGVRATEALTKDYNREISNRAAVILTKGSTASQQAFVKVAKEIGGPSVLTTSALDPYRKMAADVDPTIGSEREFAGTQLGHLLRSLEAVGKESGSSFLKTPTLIDGVFVTRTFDDLVLGIKDLLLKQVGPVLTRDFVQTVVCQEALKLGFKESVMPVVVTDTDEMELAFFSSNLFGGVGIVVELPEDAQKIDNTYVVSTFDALKAARKQASQQLNPNNQ